MPSTVVRPADPQLSRALRLGAIFALATVLFHLLANLYEKHIGYGYFRDEFYYILCGRRLAWGYVDHGPLVALQARLSETFFGHSLAGLRFLSSLAGAGRVFLSGILTWALGGRRPAQALAMFAVAFAPAYLALDGFLSMNSVESVFWMLCLLALLLMLRGGSPRLWLLFGSSAGLGLLNKPSITFFLLALLAGLLLTRQRRLLATPWAAAGVLLMFLIISPWVSWQFHHHWATWEFLQNGRLEHKNKILSPVTFLLTQVLNLNPASALIWIPGLILLLRRRELRFLGLTYLFFLLGMLVLHAKDYYVIPIYPILFAAGGLAWETRFAHRTRVQRDLAFAFPVAIATLAVISVAVLPMDTPILRPASWVTYARVTHQFNAASNSENSVSGPLPQFYADRFGWQEEVDILSRSVNALPPEKRAVACIWGSNYGEAGAADFLGRGLPPVISGHNNYFLWGSHGCTGEVIIAVTPTSVPELQQEYTRVTLVGHLDNPWSMPYERRNIFLLEGRKHPLAPDWPKTKGYI